MKAILVTLCFLFLFHGFSRAKGERKQNILWLIGENLTTHDLACYGGSNVHTPRLDALAAEGVLHPLVFFVP